MGAVVGKQDLEAHCPRGWGPGWVFPAGISEQKAQRKGLRGFLGQEGSRPGVTGIITVAARW